jgi:hypothetical protein
MQKADARELHHDETLGLMKSRVLRTIFAIALCWSWLGAASFGEPKAATQGDLPKPEVIVFCDHSSIQENDELIVDLWFSNTTDVELSKVVLHVDSPAFLRWYTVDTTGKKEAVSDQGEPWTFGPVKPGAISTCRLSLKSGSDIQVGDFSLLFAFEYEWSAGGATRAAMVSSEKTLRVNLFGSDAIAGIPLALAGFIVPGLFCWLAARLFKVPGTIELPLGDRMIYSVLISILFVVAGRWISVLEITNGIGAKKLSYLAAAGILLGVLIGVVWKWWSAAQEARLIQEDDSAETVLLKLLRKNQSGKKPKVTVELADGRRYAGSAFYRGPSATIILVGWCKISQRSVKPPVLDQMRSLAKDSKYSQLLELAINSHASLSWDGVVEWLPDGSQNYSESAFKKWDHVKANDQPEPEAAEYPPVRLIE